jgi:hypothetical protein
MLVKFDSDIGSFTMFGEIAVALLKMMGHSGTVPSAILARDIPAALDRLNQALASYRDPAPAPAPGGEERPEPPVVLRTRAWPLIDLLTRATERNADVTWRQLRPAAESTGRCRGGSAHLPAPPPDSRGTTLGRVMLPPSLRATTR